MNEKILVLAPHTDDGELGCGATIVKHLEAGNEVYYAAFSSCAQSLLPQFQPDTLITECLNATTALGLKKENVFFFDFEVRKFPTFRQEILEEMVQLNKKIKPSSIYIPAVNDVHQDHHVIYQEGLRAFKNCNLFGYELPWNNVKFQPNYFEKISNNQLQKKCIALTNYKSQAHRKYMAADFINALATVRGMQADAPFAEAFELYKYIN